MSFDDTAQISSHSFAVTLVTRAITKKRPDMWAWIEAACFSSREYQILTWSYVHLAPIKNQKWKCFYRP